MLAFLCGLFASKVIAIILSNANAYVSSHGTDKEASSAEWISIVLHFNFSVSLAAFVLGYFLLESAPLIAPSNSTRRRGFLRQRLLLGSRMAQGQISQSLYPMRLEERENSRTNIAMLPSSSAGLMRTLVDQYQILTLGKEFSETRFLAASFVFGPAVIFCLLLHAQLFQSSDAGSCQNLLMYIVIMISSTIGAITAAASVLACGLMHSNHHAPMLVSALKVANSVGLVAVGNLMFVAQESLTALGFVWFMYSAITVVYIENLLEYTYPISEDISFGCLLTLSYSIVGIPAAILMKRMVFQSHKENSLCTNFGTLKLKLCVISLASFGFVLLLCCKKIPLKRTEQDIGRQQRSEEEPLLAVNGSTEV